MVGLLVAIILLSRKKERLCPLGCAGSHCEPFCACIKGWEGDRCETQKRCPGDGKCSGRGTCTDGECACTKGTGWSGAECGTPNCPDDCESQYDHGECDKTTTGQCVCKDIGYGKWSADNCSQAPAGNCIYNPGTCDSPNPNWNTCHCSDHGACDWEKTGWCTCNKGWEGASCETENKTYGCDPTKGCFKGAGGMTLANCSKSVCKPCPQGCGNLACDTKTGQCVCDPTVTCHGHGSCATGKGYLCTCSNSWDVNNNCATCMAGWSGPDCTIPSTTSCLNDCESQWGHGDCDLATGQCICKSTGQGKWSGADCSQAPADNCINNQGTCDGPNPNLNTCHCSDHGPCDWAKTGLCTCDPGWTGYDCRNQSPIPDFFLGGWLESGYNFTELTKGKCYNLIYKNQPQEVSDATGWGLGGYKTDIDQWRAKGNIFIASRLYGAVDGYGEMCNMFNAPDGPGDSYDQKAWAAKFKDGDVKVDGFMFNYEPPDVNDNTWYLDCMEHFLKYLNDNPDVYCGERNIIFFSFSIAFISERQSDAKSAIKRLGKMITNSPRLNVFYEFQKYQEDKNFGKVVSSFKKYYGDFLSNCVLVTDTYSFIKHNNGSASKLAKAMKNVKNQGLRGLTFWWISNTLPGLDGHLPQDLIDAGKQLC